MWGNWALEDASSEIFWGHQLAVQTAVLSVIFYLLFLLKATERYCVCVCDAYDFGVYGIYVYVLWFLCIYMIYMCRNKVVKYTMTVLSICKTCVYSV